MRNETKKEAAPASGIRILIAEDNFVNQKLLRIILERDGHAYEIAENGADAIEQYQTGQFDLVLMDCQMPNVDGLQASRQIREFEAAGNKRRCPILAMTANAMSGDREKCISHGMDDFIAKPFKPNELSALIKTWSVK